MLLAAIRISNSSSRLHSKMFLHSTTSLRSLATLQTITPQQFHSQFTPLVMAPVTTPSGPVQLVDVRNHDEVESHGKIKGALNIPYHVAEDQPKLFSTVLNDLDRSRKVNDKGIEKLPRYSPHTNLHTLFRFKVVFQCASGRRSKKAAEIAMDLGFQQVYNMEGGFSQWQKDKLPVQPFAQNHSPWVHTVMEGNTDTAQYIVTDLGKAELSESLSSPVSSLFFVPNRQSGSICD